MLVVESLHEIQGRTLVCKVDNQSLMTVMARKESTRILALNQIGKNICWLQQLGEFSLRLKYVKSEDNRADIFTRQSPGLETSLTNAYFQRIWAKMGLFDWDLMATSANVNVTPLGTPLPFFSSYYDAGSRAVNVFSQVLEGMEAPFCFSPEPIILMLLKLLQAQKRSCVVLVPHANGVWANLLKLFAVETVLVSKPFDNSAFTITHPTGKRVPKIFHHAMIAAKLVF